MTERIIIAGSGGQGIMLLGKVLAEAAMLENKFVTWLPCYGAEVRGGTAYCMLVISDGQIGSPYVEKADALIVMNQPSFDKFKSRLKAAGLLIVNTSLVQKASGRANAYPFTDIAERLGNIRVANMVALGVYLEKTKALKIENVFKAMERIAPSGKKGLIEINKTALKEGMKLK